jgi:predicted small lipoprotein YifL
MVCLAAAGTAGLAACGQRGPLFLPTDPAAAQRATLPQLLTPGIGNSSSSATDAAAPSPAAASSAPAPGSSTGSGTETRK